MNVQAKGNQSGPPIRRPQMGKLPMPPKFDNLAG